jgi:hypothetical protein
MSRFRTFRRWSHAERGVACTALAMLPLAALGLRWLGLRRTQALLVRPPRGRGGDAPGDLAQAQALARIVAAAARHGPYRARCLATALTLRSILRRRGIESSLRFGVRRGPRGIEAHAWVEHCGVALADPTHLQAFSAFAPLDEADHVPAP